MAADYYATVACFPSLGPNTIHTDTQTCTHTQSPLLRTLLTVNSTKQQKINARDVLQGTNELNTDYSIDRTFNPQVCLWIDIKRSCIIFI
jgi:hypothetical protein